MKKVILALIMVVGAMLAFTSCDKESPTKVVKTYHDALVAQDFKAAMDCLCSKDGQPLSKEKKDNFAAMMEEKAKKEDTKGNMIASYEVIEQKVAEDGKTATVTVKTKTVKGLEKTDKLNCILTDGKWYINSNK